MRYFCVASYDGTNYAGWQIQPNAVSIQQTIEERLGRILNTETKIYGSGRTDAKVHALGQTFHFDAKEIDDLDKFRYSFNQVLPNDIFIKSIIKVTDEFNARLSAVSKTYSYVLNNGEMNPFKRNYETFYPKHLDLQKMIEASKEFIGVHNFQNFTSKDEDENNFVREIFSIDIKEENHIFTFTFKGDGFMRYMIRFIVGSLLQVGIDKISIDDIKASLNSKERHIISFKAEPQGLYLCEVNYAKK